MRGKKVTFNVDVKNVNELASPKVDEAFAAQAGPFKTVNELRADIKKQLKDERTAQADREYANEVVKKITDKSEVEIPEKLIEEQVARLEDEEKQNLAYQGQTWQEHLKLEGINEEEHRTRHRPDALMRVKGGLVLSEIAEKESITVEPEELQIRIKMLKGQYTDEKMQAELDKLENQQDIASQILTEKTLARLVKYSSS